MKLRLDPWPAEFDSPAPFDHYGAPEGLRVETDIEGSWSSINPPPLPTVCCHFVDGVRRVDARVVATASGDRPVHGLYGCAAAGFVRAHGSTAEFGSIEVRRYLILGANQELASHIQAGRSTLVFEAATTSENSPDAVLGELQSRMRQAEARFAESLAAAGTCVFVDGLSFRATGAQPVIGVIKRILVPYLPAAQFALAETLRTGQRTPLFKIVDSVYDRYSCYLRLQDPRPFEHSTAGLVRIEIGAMAGLEQARGLAQIAAACLPRFAGSPVRDPRAPQNLMPVGALESEMRRRLGDPVLIRRAIEKELYDQRDR